MIEECDELKRGAKAGNLSRLVAGIRWTPAKARARAVIMTKDGVEKRFASAHDAAARMGMNTGSIYAAISQGITYRGWLVRYGDRAP